MKIAIPTHRRSDTINKLTLSLLTEFDKKDIHLFISDEADMSKYMEVCPDYNLVLCGTDNATDKFNYIQNYFDVGVFVIVIEDDIKQIQSLMTKNLQKLFSFIVNYCNNKKINSFGVYPSSNKFFMSKTIDIGATYIVANLFGFRSTKDHRVLCQLKTKTDYERSVKYYKYMGNIARFNFISCLTNNYKNQGGMQDIADRASLERQASLMLCKLYPDIFSINANRKSQYTEIQMVKNVVKEQL